MNPLITQIASALFWTLYGSFFEWYFHKYWMHQPRPPREAFHGHTVVHHGIYKGDESFFLDKEAHPQHILLKPYALPAIVLVHLPLVWAIEYYLIPHTFWGAMIATLIYFVVYEYMHWNMHVPQGKFVERFRWFQFLRSHHKLHHRFHMKNFCVLFPLADWAMGTLETEASMAKRKAAREAALAAGLPLPDRKQKIRRSRPKKSEVKFSKVNPEILEKHGTFRIENLPALIKGGLKRGSGR